jgi:hypothetical protein
MGGTIELKFLVVDESAMASSHESSIDSRQLQLATSPGGMSTTDEAGRTNMKGSARIATSYISYTEHKHEILRQNAGSGRDVGIFKDTKSVEIRATEAGRPFNPATRIGPANL